MLFELLASGLFNGSLGEDFRQKAFGELGLVGWVKEEFKTAFVMVLFEHEKRTSGRAS